MRVVYGGWPAQELGRELAHVNMIYLMTYETGGEGADRGRCGRSWQKVEELIAKDIHWHQGYTT